MHMGDALLSPAVAGVMCAISAGGVALSSRKVRAELDERKVPLMGVLGAFVFSAQMINFAIPGTGSSGHLGGGLLLSILLGPHAAFLTIASVLVVQALLFADGGVLALGANIFNLGFFPAFVAYPLICRPFADSGSRFHSVTAAIAAAVVGLEAGAFAVSLETAASGITALPFRRFLPLMLGIHLPIAIVEGIVTAAVVECVRRVRPDVTAPRAVAPLRSVAGVLLVAALFLGGWGSWYASDLPDGLEWAVELVAEPAHAGSAETVAAPHRDASRVPLDTSCSGVVGGVVSLGLAFTAGTFLKRTRRKT